MLKRICFWSARLGPQERACCSPWLGFRASGFSEILVASRGGCCIPFWAAFDPHLWSFLSIPDALAFIVHKNNFCHIQAFVPFNSRISIPRACFIGKQIWGFFSSLFRGTNRLCVSWQNKLRTAGQ